MTEKESTLRGDVSQQDDASTTSSRKRHSPELRNISNQVLRYFREFIQTDFKRQQAPRRRIQLKTAAGFRSAVDLSKYPGFFKDAWALMAEPSSEMALSIRPRKYRADVSPTLKNLVKQFVTRLDESTFSSVRQSMVEHALSRRVAFHGNPDGFVDEVQLVLASHVDSALVRPVMALFDTALRENSDCAHDDSLEVQAELTDLLCDVVAPHLGEAINSLLLDACSEALRDVFTEFFCAVALCPLIESFFEAFAAADVLDELRQLHDFMRSDDILCVYLYLGTIRSGSHVYPLFFLPVQLRALESEPGFTLTVEPRLFVHKQAIEYAAAQSAQPSDNAHTETNRSSGVSQAKTTRTEDSTKFADSNAGGAKTLPTPGNFNFVNDRIIHLAEPGSPRTARGEVQRVMADVASQLELAGRIDFSSVLAQTSRSSSVRMSNAVHLAVFDRNDESLVNDYEALLSSIDADHQAAQGLFTDLVSSMLFDEPESVSAAVRKEWDGMSASSRLVVPSVIPLNEEQARIDVARRKGTRFIAVEGPPGTGKSHAIAALSFNAIMDGLSVLIVSDKNEALEVVQDKLTQALQSVRHGDDFPNPILRLGKDGTYRTLISASSRVKIENHHRAQSANMDCLERELAQHTLDLTQRMESAIVSLSSMKMSDLAYFHRVESSISRQIGEPLQAAGWMGLLEKFCDSGRTQQITALFAGVSTEQRQALSAAFASAASASELLTQLRVAAACATVQPQITPELVKAMACFAPLRTAQASDLTGFIARIEHLKTPVIGFLFKGKALGAIEAEISKTLPCTASAGLARQTPVLRSVVLALELIGQAVRSVGLAPDRSDLVYAWLLNGGKPMAFAVQGAALVGAVLETLSSWQADAATGFEQIKNGSVVDFVFACAEFITLNTQLKRAFAAVPRVDFVKEKAQLEAMHTARLAHRLDSRFLEFVEKHRATAQALGGVVKARSQFPVEQFKMLSHAFPCVIAGIRELAEFVPLKTEMFDLCIMDEGSQVSVAQAMPAMLRAKQIIVFGDRKQFSNVKSHNASNAINAAYLSDLHEAFRRDISAASDKLQRLQRFDVKRSVLEFIELVAGHTEMLRKHFRGYPELISYSSKHFYDGTLQAIKIRAKPIDEVIRFELVQAEEPLSPVSDKTDKAEARRNTNPAEAKRIMEILEGLLSGEPHAHRLSVGVITPFSEQAAYLSAMVCRHPMGERMDRELKLKVMTADSCQGEERDIIIYSMVATRERDVLNFVFPVELKTNDDENDTLKAQRLNVAFSRAKETMIFILSKPPEEFGGSLGRALMHYKAILDNRSMATDEQVDPSSPMERKVLHWLKNTRLMQQHGDRLELVAQFPVGNYLRQLDPTYKHPAYKVDFLLRHHGEKLSNIIIEYDGFEHHFTDREKVTAANHEWYQKPQDVERQFILESYGYRFLRINRFNIGRDPVATLDERLAELISQHDLEHVKPAIPESSSVQRIRDQAQALDTQQSKTCGRCKEIKDKAAFFDPTLAGSLGAYGRVCRSCKLKR